MANEYLVIFDKGDNWEVTNVFVTPDGFETSNEGVWDVSDNKELFEFVRNSLKENRIFFSKDIDGKLIREDLIIEPYDRLTMFKQRKLTDGKDLVSSRVSVAEVFDAVEYIMLNVFFMEKGIYITDNNRTEKYLEVVELGDEEIIDKLERYLDIRDNMLMNLSWIDSYKLFRNKIDLSNSIEEIEKIWKDYVQTFE